MSKPIGMGSLIGSPASSGGIALVQSASGTTADGSAGLTVNFGVPVTAGNSVLSFPSIGDNNNLSVAPTLVGGGASVLSQVAIDDTRGWGSVFTYKKTNVTGGETGVTFSSNEAVRANNIIAEYSGLADAAAEDTATNTATSTTLAIGTITPTSANNLLTAIFAFDADVTVVTPPAGWTLVDARQGGASVWQYVYQKIQTSADASNPTIVLSGSADIAGAAAAFGGA